MTWVIVGLGNPDEKYARTRHNAGRMAVQKFAKAHELSEWKEDKKANAFIARGLIERALTLAILPNTYMNKSGNAVSRFVKSVKAAEKLIIVYDELDLPLGTMKVSFDRGSGGHKGLESIIRALKTTAFVRIRIGISPSSASGEIKKPEGEKNVEKFILGDFSSSDTAVLSKVFKRVSEALETIIRDGRATAMNQFN
ncbi:MAG: aminoacyl-tRNA hydrolase [Patescibacteria group bacterium]